MAAQNSMMLAERTDELLHRGRSQGFLSAEEVAGLAQEGDLSPTQREDVYAALAAEQTTPASAAGAGSRRRPTWRSSTRRWRRRRYPASPARSPRRRRAAGSPPPCRSPRLR